MITPLLKTALEPVADRHRRLRVLDQLTLWWFGLAAAGAVLLASGRASVTWLLLLAATAVIGALVIRRRVREWEPDLHEVARRIEQRHPELHAVLVTAVEQTPSPDTKELNYLQQRVIAEAIRRTREHQWLDAIPRTRWAGSVGLQLLALAAMFTLFRMLNVPESRAAIAQNAPARDGVEVTPGDTQLERGSGLVVLATFHRDVPGEAVLVVHPQNQPPQRLPLVKNLSDPVFGGGLPEVDADLTYHVEYADKSTRPFTVKVFEHPRLERADAKLRFPDYTKLAEKNLPDTRRVSAVEGTKLDVAFQLNKPVKSATLVTKQGEQVPLALEEGKATATLSGFDVKASGSYEVQLVDADGRANKVPAQFTVEALPNRRPELKFAAPKGDQRVSPIEELAFRAEAWDDFGLSRYGLTLNVAGRGEQEMELGRESGADERREFAHLMALEKIGVKPDELVTWFLWAEDIGPDGEPRRTASDMFFGEVRPFEEIYRRGDDAEAEQQQQQQQQGGGQGNQATKLAEMQKQIISATWNLKRAEDAAPKSPSEKYLKDEPVVRDSQGEALKMATELGAKVEEPKSRALVENVTREMKAAFDKLTAATQTPAPLPDALASEQLAYNALLKLAAHEFRVSRSQGGGGQGSQGGNQQQLDQLELKEEKQRYETKRQADPMQNEQQREQLGILNRLKELAQRQQDINERLQELQTALQAAHTEKEKEEIKRQLKRLREEEQQLLADMDEARQKMEQSPQQAQLAEERRKLDQTRSEAQQASEAMERNAASQALASGTRAAQKLEEMRDDFRKKTSGQFNDQMRDMRADARELAQKQQEISEKLKGDPAKPERPTLDSSGEREQLTQQLEKQKAQLADVTEQMKRVSEAAEPVEPLLAKELYETLRKTAQAGTDQKLERTQLLAERGYSSHAQKFEEKARVEIDELKAGVERAAESVLGDEAEALKQARAELDSLSEQLDGEIAQARPDLAQAGSQGPSNSDDPARENPGSALVPSAGSGVPPKRTSNPSGSEGSAGPENADAQEVRPGETPRPARGTRALPGAEPSSRDAGANPAESPTENSASSPGTQPGQEPSGQTAQNAGQQGSAEAQQKGSPGGSQQLRQQPGSSGQGQTGTAQNSGPQGNQPSQQSGRGGGSGESSNGSSEEGQRRERLAQLLSPSSQPGSPRSGSDSGGRGGGPVDGAERPLTGEEFVRWSDRLRNVEEMLDAPELRNEAARIRELAKGVRVEFKRHSVPPNWELVQTSIGKPLAELRNRLTEELARRESKENLVPIDRDPVPTKYAERVRRYYEELGRSR